MDINNRVMIRVYCLFKLLRLYRSYLKYKIQIVERKKKKKKKDFTDRRYDRIDHRNVKSVANYHRPINRSRSYIRLYCSGAWYNRVEISLYKGLLIEITFTRWCYASIESPTSWTPRAPNRWCAKCNKLQNSSLSWYVCSFIRVAPRTNEYPLTCVAETRENPRFENELCPFAFFNFFEKLGRSLWERERRKDNFCETM